MDTEECCGETQRWEAHVVVGQHEQRRAGVGSGGWAVVVVVVAVVVVL